jgi:hypothetical protein
VAITLVQSKSGTGTSLTLSSATTAGNCLVVVVSDVGISAPAVTAVTLGGSAGNFSTLIEKNTTVADGMVSIWADPNCGASTAIAITETNGNTPVITAFEFSGLVSASVLDLSSSQQGTSSAWSSGSTATTTQAAEAWVGGAMAKTVISGPSSPWTNTGPTVNGSCDAIAGYQITTSAGAAVYTGSINANWTAAVVTLKGTSAALPPALVPPQPPRRTLSRGIVQGRAVAPVIPVPRLPLPPPPRSLPPRRGITAGRAVPGVVRVQRVPLGSRLAPRRTLSRAWIWFTPVRTVNGTPPPPVNGTLPLGSRLAPRRTLARAVVRFTPVIPPVNASPPGLSGLTIAAMDEDRLGWWKKRRFLISFSG